MLKHRAIAILAAAATALAMPGAARADYAYYDGEASLGLSRNAGEIGCWVEQDCPEGEVCHATVRIGGEAATRLAELLMMRVEKDPTFADWGLEIYVSANDGLFCDVTEPDRAQCTFSLNAQTAEMEPPLSCE
ncbi:MAG: hypothetical protein KKH72_08700 [Alphaproteobacteria bacterium]|nr:hypothetical protein [Alphaproteobacteria bacterium]